MSIYAYAYTVFRHTQKPTHTRKQAPTHADKHADSRAGAHAGKRVVLHRRDAFAVQVQCTVRGGAGSGAH